jgi:hypothetical protein
LGAFFATPFFAAPFFAAFGFAVAGASLGAAALGSSAGVAEVAGVAGGAGVGSDTATARATRCGPDDVVLATSVFASVFVSEGALSPVSSASSWAMRSAWSLFFSGSWTKRKRLQHW